MKDIKDIYNNLKTGKLDLYEINSYTILYSGKALQEEQMDWHEEDSCKTCNYTSNSIYLVVEGEEPEEMSLDDIIKLTSNDTP